jgi:CheY-like chemotaxis protein
MSHAARRYLCVDDNVEFLENLAEILTSQGAVVDAVTNGAEALEHLAAHRYHAVVTDLKMPGLSGVELLQQLRRLDPDVPVVLLSAWSDERALKEARRSGLYGSVSKASQVPRLLELLEAAQRGLVLVVEDDEALVENLAEALSPLGYTVVPALTVGELDAVAVTPRAALVDLKVPGAEVGASLERVRARFPQAHTVVITALLDEGEQSRGTEVFRKPFRTADLARRVDELMRVGE